MLFPIMIFKVEGESMEPNIHRDRYVVASKYILRKPRKGDVVILRHPKTGMKLIKRISEIRDDEYYVLGDNLNHSEDARSFGPVREDMIIGRVIL